MFEALPEMLPLTLEPEIELDELSGVYPNAAVTLLDVIPVM